MQLYMLNSAKFYEVVFGVAEHSVKYYEFLKG
jgi:hypothetical protein